MHPGADFLYEEWLKRTIPYSSENIQAVHLIFKKDSLNYFDLMDNIQNFDTDFLIGYVFTLLLFSLICLFLSRIKFKANRNYLKSSPFSKINQLYKNLLKPKHSSFKLIFLFLAFFFWFTNLLLQGKIKVSKVVVC